MGKRKDGWLFCGCEARVYRGVVYEVPAFSTHFCLRLVKEMMDRTDPDPLIRTGEQLCLKTLDIAMGLQYGIRYRCNLEQGNQFHGLQDFGVRRRSWP